MIKGEINGDQQAVVTLEIMDSQDCPCPVQVVLDTGFSGYLTLPFETIQRLGLAWVGRRTFEATNGRISELDAYIASVSWHGHLTDTLVLRSEGPAKLGMGTLWGSRVTLDAVEQGEVHIHELPGEAAKGRPDSQPKLRRFFGGVRVLARSSLSAVLFSVFLMGVILWFAFGVVSLKLGFGEKVTYMGVWLAVGVLLGQNKPYSMPIWRYLVHRIVSIMCYFGVFLAIGMVYVWHFKEPSEQITWVEIIALAALSLVSLALGFLAGQDKEPNS